jgi:hypothetical protein
MKSIWDIRPSDGWPMSSKKHRRLTYWKPYSFSIHIHSSNICTTLHSHKLQTTFFTFTQGLGYTFWLLEVVLASIYIFVMYNWQLAKDVNRNMTFKKKFKIAYSCVTKICQLWQIGYIVFSHIQDFSIFSTKM